MYKLKYATSTKKEFKRIDKSSALKILGKLEEFCEDPLKNAESLKNPNLPGYRFRIGQYRVMVDIDTKNEIISVVKVGHRKEIY